MNGGITKVRGQGIPTVRCVNALEVLRYLVKSFFPPQPLPTLSSAADRMSEPVFVIVKVLQGNGLRADVPAAQRVVVVAANVETVVSLNSDLDATDRLAEIAGSIVWGGIVGGSHGTNSYPHITQITTARLWPPPKENDPRNHTKPILIFVMIRVTLWIVLSVNLYQQARNCEPVFTDLSIATNDHLYL
jgi:hypothetical protein